MRMIGQLPAEPYARRFVDYLLTRSVAAHAEETANGGWLIWVEHDDQVDAAKEELAAFAVDPAASRFDSAANAEQIRREEAKATEKRQKNYRDVRTTMFSAPGGAIPATLLLIALSVIVSLMSKFGADDNSPLLNHLFFDDPTRYTNDDVPARFDMFNSILRGEAWRLVTPIFIHFGIIHLLFNMMWMIDLGRRIESVRGSFRFLLIVLTIAVLSCTAQALWAAFTEKDHYSLFGGMSGVVSGLLGYCWMCWKFRPYERIGITNHEVGYMIGWLVICSFGIIGPIANAAHWGGLVVGMALGAAPSLWKRR